MSTAKANTQEREERLKKLNVALKIFVSSFAQNSDYKRWNTTNINATITKVLMCLNTYDRKPSEDCLNPAWVKPLYLAVQEDYKRMSDKNSKQYVETFYNAIEELEATMVRDGWNFVKSAIDDNSVDVLMAFIEAVKSSYNCHGYNFHNYDFIKSKIGLTYRMLSDFDCNFRGEIQQYHNVNETYQIIECKKFNNDEGVKDWETTFYNIKDGSTCYSTFNDALICTMFGRFSNSVCVLFEQKEKEDKEAEELKKEKLSKKLSTSK